VNETEMDAETFIELCAINKIEKQAFIQKYSEEKCQMIAEPDGINKFPETIAEHVSPAKKGFFAKLFSR
jgi:hypothetical protein